MTDDQRALQEASELITRGIERERRNPRLSKKLNQISNRPELSDRTSEVILYAIDKWRKNSEGYALRILMEEQDRRKSGPEDY